MELIFATHNPNKVIEVREILKSTPYTVRSLEDIGYNDEIIEDGATLEANAWIKARTIHKATGLNIVADDTGLEVFTLSGAPGVYSARYAGAKKDSNANMNKLLGALKDQENRSAQFRTAVACIIENQEYQCEGTVQGMIIEEKRGGNGFGYDPIFMPEGYLQTFGELSDSIKNSISHRARAFHALRDILNKV